jgi:hypothetical protein
MQLNSTKTWNSRFNYSFCNGDGVELGHLKKSTMTHHEPKVILGIGHFWADFSQKKNVSNTVRSGVEPLDFFLSSLDQLMGKSTGNLRFLP